MFNIAYDDAKGKANSIDFWPIYNPGDGVLSVTSSQQGGQGREPYMVASLPLVFIWANTEPFSV